MAISNNNYQNVTKILVYFLRDQIDFCPTKHNLVIEERLLLETAIRSKLQHVLFHFLTCDNCRIRVTKSWIAKIHQLHVTSIYRAMVWQREKETLNTVLIKYCVHGILFKQHKKIHQNDKMSFTGSDVDVIVSHADFHHIILEYIKMGYQKKLKGIHKEIQLVHPKYSFEIDLHFLIAYPHFSELNEKEHRMAQSLTNDLLKNTPKNTYGLVELSLEWYLLALLIRYWHNDLMTGLRDLKTIIEYMQLPKTLLLWDNFMHLVKKYDMKNELFFVLSVGSNIFKEPLPKKIQSAIPWWIRQMAASISVKDIALFPPIMKWNWKIYRQQVDIIYRQYDIIRRILKPKAWLYRLAHPRDFYYFIWHIIEGFMHILSKRVGLIHES